MSKSLKKLIDINRLREFKNKLVEIGSAYVQTGAVDQTVAGTKTFSKPIVGSVTGSSGSCTGNAASANIATKADSATKAANADHATSADSATNATYANWLRTSSNTDYLFHTEWDSTGYFLTYVTADDGGYRAVRVARSDSAANADHATSADSATNATYANWLRTSSHSDHLFHIEWDGGLYFWAYVTAGGGEYRAVRVARSDSSGYADTATKLATARTIALSGAATGTATAFDGSGNITIPVTALASSAIRAQWYAAYPDGAEAHNTMWGGRDITAAFDSGEFSEHIADGTFKDIFPGDYITKQVTIDGTAYTVNWVIADCDYWINKGDTATTVHHVVIVPQAPIFNAWMNPTNTTEGGYAGSEMYKNVIPACATGIVSAFGSDHILTFRDAISDRVDTFVSSGIPQWIGTPGWWDGAWVSAQCNLMSEKMVYGAPVCSAGAMDNVMATRQMSAFRLSERLINYNRNAWWLRDVVSSLRFASADGDGTANTSLASHANYGVRPFALLC